MRDYVGFGVLWVILSALGEWGASAWGNHFYYFVGSTVAADGQDASKFILLIGTPIFIFVVMVLFYALFRGSRRDLGNSKSQVRSNKAFISIWVGLSIVINLFLFVHPTVSAMQGVFDNATALNQAAQSNSANAPLEVDVVARQWEWFFSYPQYGISESVDANGNDILVLPVNRPVKFVLRSYDPSHWYDVQADVIHSFWVPAFGIKTDVIPGETRYEYVTPTVIASTATNPMMRVQCAEVCGPGHPYMETPAQVESATDFAAWVKQEQKLQGS